VVEAQPIALHEAGFNWALWVASQLRIAALLELIVFVTGGYLKMMHLTTPSIRLVRKP
jgi:hypothetical protein